MRYLFGFICLLALGVMGCSETAGTGGSGDGGHGGGGVGGDGGHGGGGVGGGPPREFEAGPAVAVSGPSPIADCEEVPPEGWAHAETEPWIVVNPTNRDNVVGLWIQDRNPRRALVAAVSMDGGATWESVVLPGLSKCSGGEWDWTTDPWLAFSPNGDLYASALSIADATDTEPNQSAILAQKSTDGGLTWSNPVVVDMVEGPLFNDKESITADPFDECTAYIGWDRFFDRSVDLSFVSLFSRTTDCGETWEEPILVNDLSLGGLQLVVMPDGSLRAFGVGWPDTAGQADLVAQESTDQGDTWSEPVRVSTTRRYRPFTADGSTRIRSGNTLFDVAIDHNTGHLYAVWEQLFVPAPNSTPVQVAFSASTDGGLTWSTPIRIDQTPAVGSPHLEQAFLPSVEVAGNGAVGVTYYSFQNATLGTSTSPTDHWFVYCNPAGGDCNDESGWAGSEIQVTSESFDYLLAPKVGSALFLGDYVGLAAAGDDFFAFFPVTTEDDPASALFVPIRAR